MNTFLHNMKNIYLIACWFKAFILNMYYIKYLEERKFSLLLWPNKLTQRHLNPPSATYRCVKCTAASFYRSAAAHIGNNSTKSHNPTIANWLIRVSNYVLKVSVDIFFMHLWFVKYLCGYWIALHKAEVHYTFKCVYSVCFNMHIAIYRYLLCTHPHSTRFDLTFQLQFTLANLREIHKCLQTSSHV